MRESPPGQGTYYVVMIIKYCKQKIIYTIENMYLTGSLVLLICNAHFWMTVFETHKNAQPPNMDEHVPIYGTLRNLMN